MHIMPIIRTIRPEFIKFFLVGISNVFVDLFIYRLSLTWLDISLSKGLSFCFGTLYSYHLNRVWTFTATTRSFQQFSRFIGISGFALGVNVATNSSVLSILPSSFKFPLAFAYVIATTLSAILNFLGMKCFVFKKIKSASNEV